MAAHGERHPALFFHPRLGPLDGAAQDMTAVALKGLAIGVHNVAIHTHYAPLLRERLGL